MEPNEPVIRLIDSHEKWIKYLLFSDSLEFFWFIGFNFNGTFIIYLSVVEFNININIKNCHKYNPLSITILHFIVGIRI